MAGNAPMRNRPDVWIAFPGYEKTVDCSNLGRTKGKWYTAVLLVSLL